jgi:hypothetical protein
MTIANMAVLVVGCLHLLIAALEMFLWRQPFVFSGLKRAACYALRFGGERQRKTVNLLRLRGAVE